jgi:hypothetical protein
MIVTLWVGSLWTMGFLIAPALFRILPDRMQAGALAGRLLSVVAYTGLACAACLLLLALTRLQNAGMSRSFLGVILAMAVLTVVGEFGIQPILSGLKAEAAPLDVMHSALRDRFAAWHGISSGVYVLNCVLGVALVVLQHRRAREPGG